MLWCTELAPAECGSVEGWRGFPRCWALLTCWIQNTIELLLPSLPTFTNPPCHAARITQENCKFADWKISDFSLSKHLCCVVSYTRYSSFLIPRPQTKQRMWSFNSRLFFGWVLSWVNVLSLSSSLVMAQHWISSQHHITPTRDKTQSLHLTWHPWKPASSLSVCVVARDM